MGTSMISKTILLLFLLSSLSIAANMSMPLQALNLFNDSKDSAFLLKLSQEMEAANATRSQTDMEMFFAKGTLLVMGSFADAPEKAAFEAAKASYPMLANATPQPDSDLTLSKIESNAGDYGFIVLIGGPGQNRITKKAIKEKWLNETEDFYSGFVVQYGKTPSGVLIVAISDKRGYENAARESVQYSPLSAFMEPQYVPIAATGISVFLLALISIVRTIFEFKALEIGRKGKKVGDNALMVGPVNIKEAGAICGASLVLGISVSWQYFGPTTDFVFWTIINTIICLFAAILHEVSHRSLAAMFGMKVEYRFWKEGSLLTLVSSYLGNAFSVQGFLLEEIPENTAKWKIALMRIVGPLISTVTMVGFAIINLVFPNIVFQMIIATSALWAIAEVFPFNGLDGKDLKEWNIFVWLFTFCFVAAAYAVVTFVL